MPGVPVTVPSVGESITEGILSRWLKADGASVQAGEPLFELETDKASSNVPAAGSGVLHIQVAEGETVAIGATVATIDPADQGGKGASAPGDGPAAAERQRAQQSSPVAPGPPPLTPPSQAGEKTRTQPSSSVAPGPPPRIPPSQGGEKTRTQPSSSVASGPPPLTPPSQGGEKTRTQPSSPVAPGPPPLTPPSQGGEKTRPQPKPQESAGESTRPLSPAARRVVAEHEVDAARIPATGPGGRVTKGDVLAFLESGPDAAASPPGAPPAPAASAGVGEPESGIPDPKSPIANRESRQRMSGLRQRIAQRLVEIQQTAAILTTFNEADLSRVMELRALYKETFAKKHGVSLGFMSFFIKAAVQALKAYPIVNARIDGNDIVYHNFHDIGVAVSTERGLVVPVVRDAALLSFAGIEKTIATLAARARDRTITVDDLQGGTFTITNGGTFGSLMSTPILNPPQSAILGMHAIKKRPVVVDDQIVIRPMMYLALSYDHRLIDGQDAVSFLVSVKDSIENPERMMFEL